MALQAGVSTSKVLILVGAGLTGSVVLRSGRLSDIIAQLQELLKGVSEAEISPNKYDTAALTAQIRHLAQEIRELTLSGPVTIVNGKSSSEGSYASYLMPTVALGVAGYCYMWLKGLSLSDVMFVTKQNMANAVETVSKQLEQVNSALASTKRHLTKRLENLDWKVEEEIKTTKLIANDVNEAKLNLSQIGIDVGTIHEMVSQLEGKLVLLESKQDATNSGLWYLCQAAGDFRDRFNNKLFQDVGEKITKYSTITPAENPSKGLQFLAENRESSVTEKLIEVKKTDNNKSHSGKFLLTRTRIHRSYPVGISLE